MKYYRGSVIQFTQADVPTMLCYQTSEEPVRYRNYHVVGITTEHQRVLTVGSITYLKNVVIRTRAFGEGAVGRGGSLTSVRGTINTEAIPSG